MLTALILTALSAHAEPDFAQQKAEMVAHLDQKIAFLNETKTCVSAAADAAALRQCREKMKDERKEMRAEHLEKRIQRLEEKKKKLQETK